MLIKFFLFFFFFFSFFSKNSGIVVQPFRGFQQEGVEGLFSGAARGLVGVVTKPLAGVFDLAAETTAAVRWG
jgi:vacuolar protein sorting-associated protein 13A/C